MSPAASPPPAPLPSASVSIATLVRTQSSVVFREAACALLRLSRSRGRGECEKLGAIFEEDLSDERRILILDLLASAGTPEAQLVMRRVLSLPLARRNSRTFATFVQRLGFIEQPETATVQFLMGVYSESHHETNEVRAACAYALGSAAGRAHAWGLVDSTVRAADVLRRDLALVREPGQKCSLLTALGKAGLERDVSIIFSFFGDPDARVRNSAALALRNMLTPEVRANLVSMLTGKDPGIAEAALSALFGQSLPEGEIIRIAELVLKGRTNPLLDARILRLVVTQKLEALMTPNVVAEAIHLLLARIEAEATRGSGEHPKVDAPKPAASADRSGEYVRMPTPKPAQPVVKPSAANQPSMSSSPVSALAMTTPPVQNRVLPPKSPNNKASSVPPAPAVAAPVVAIPPSPAAPANPGNYSVISGDSNPSNSLDATVFEKRSPVAEVLKRVEQANASPAARTVMQGSPPAPQAILARTLFQGSYEDKRPPVFRDKPTATAPLAAPVETKPEAKKGEPASVDDAPATSAEPTSSLRSQSAFSICMPKSPLASRRTR